MAEIRITNCHVHTFTTDHSPRYFPARLVLVFRWFPWLVRTLRWVAQWLPWQKVYDFLARMEAFHRTGTRKTQRDIARELLHFYPGTSRHVILPMDMELIGHGPVVKGIVAQHKELAELARDPLYGKNVVPFGTIYPDRPGGVEEFRRCVTEDGFRGLKLYPKLGFAPDHPVLMAQVYPFCVEHNLPVISHCSRGGVSHKGWTQARCDRVTAPEAYKPVLKAFPTLRICLAHFGGDQDWDQYVSSGFDPEKPEQKQENWVCQINDMISSGEYPNLWTDISYTIFKFADYSPLLRLFLEDEKLRARVLFGSDFYMTRQESLSEKAVSIRLRDALGERNFRQIAETNPAIWLGEVAEPAGGAAADRGADEDG